MKTDMSWPEYVQGMLNSLVGVVNCRIGGDAVISEIASLKLDFDSVNGQWLLTLSVALREVEDGRV